MSSTSVIQSGNPDRPKPGCDGASRRACSQTFAAYRFAGSKPSQPCRNSTGAPAPASNISRLAPAMVTVELGTASPVRWFVQFGQGGVGGGSASFWLNAD